MKIVSISNQGDSNSKAFIDFAIKQFDTNRLVDIHLEVNEKIKINNEDRKFIRSSDLFILCLGSSYLEIKKVINQQIDFYGSENIIEIFNKRPIFLLIPTDSEKIKKQHFDSIANEFLKLGSTLIGHFELIDFEHNFNNGEIVKTSLLGEFLRKINHLKRIYFKSEYKFEGFTCGINPERDYCGDAIEY